MVMGGGVPDEFACALRVENAAPSKNGETLVLASARNTLALPAPPAQMRRLFGSRGHASRQDALLAADMDAVTEEEDFEACVAYRKANRAKKNGKGSADNGKLGKRKVSAEGRATDGFNRETGERNRCYT